MLIDLINNLGKPWNILAWIGLAVAVGLLAWGLTKLNKTIFTRIQKKNNTLQLVFLEHLISILIVIGLVVLVVSTFGGVQTIWQTIFGGTAIISAVLAFAAQDVIKDILAGMMISSHHPFEVGDRIILEDGTSGIVEDISMRHVVLIGFDMVRHVIPNHRINTMLLSNYSFKAEYRSIVFNFSIGYDSDMEQAKQVIWDAIAASKYACKGLPDADGIMDYGKVLFVRFADSALILQVTVYYRPEYRTEWVLDDINVRVREALIAHHIEIPYNYVNVVNVPADTDKTEE